MNKLIFKQLQARLKLSLTYKNNILVFIKVFSQRLHATYASFICFQYFEKIKNGKCLGSQN